MIGIEVIFMQPYVAAEDLYRYKLALILGRGKRLKKVLQHYPTEKKFKAASLEEIGEVIGVSNPNSAILKKLKKLDKTYDRMVTFISDSSWSRSPRARRIMGIDTEYLKSELDCLQYIILDRFDVITSGFIFTNDKLAPSVKVDTGINILRNVINEYQPELIVGHNFNSDITILESAYGDSLPELYFYDDTMDLLEWSNLANIIGGSSLNGAVKKVFQEEGPGLFSAYQDPSLLMEYGIKDALFPVLLRYYILNGEIPELEIEFKIENVLQPENRSLLSDEIIRIEILS